MVRPRVQIAVVALAVGALSWLWGRTDWPARALIRGHLGDVAATALVYAVVGLTTRWRPRRCAIAALTIAAAIEVAQLIHGRPGGTARELVVGAHFDPLDLIAYVIGVAVAAGYDHRCRRQRP